ncbi:MAG TPA: tryptophan-rich sensory protein [Catalimonadaceae bacterium]|nr:tryptophan-rich sensory protein [Catalimonadaceae bacterium]HPI10999.1 tryptophan-rich sensory protein [Catalimonadaceae bacterium]
MHTGEPTPRKFLIDPELYQWSGITVSSILALSTFSLLIFGASHWYNSLKLPEFGFPLGVLAPFQAISVFLSGFGARIVMGNVSGNPAVKPARKSYSLWLMAHAIWLLFFAAFHWPVLSMAICVVQWGIGVFCIQKFFNVDPKAGGNLLFFFLMNTFWMLLNGKIITLNNL